MQIELFKFMANFLILYLINQPGIELFQVLLFVVIKEGTI